MPESRVVGWSEWQGAHEVSEECWGLRAQDYKAENHLPPWGIMVPSHSLRSRDQGNKASFQPSVE